MHDAVIVGGGPAGAVLALRLRARRMRVAVVDRATFPRDKSCGEGMLPTGVGIVRELGLGDAMARLDARPIRALEFVLEGRCARGALPAEGAGVDRRRLDAMLRDAARDAGVEWITGSPRALRRDGGRVRGLALDDGRRIDASVVVGADGLQSFTRRALDLVQTRPGMPRFGLCTRVEVPHHAGDHVEVHLLPGIGELYVTPTGARQLSIALLATRASVTALRGRLATAVDAATRGSPSLRRRLADAIGHDRPTATGPLATRATRPWADGALLAGDAARAIDPIGGDGMTVALAGSAACADAVARLVAGEDAAEVGRAYGRALDEVTTRRSVFVAGLLALASRPAAARFVLGGLAYAPGLVSALCAAHEGVAFA